MKHKLLTKSVLLILACIGLGLAPTLRAAHATDYLDALAAEVAARQTAEDLTPAQQRGLRGAAKILNRNTRTMGADLGLLANSANVLNRTFPGDETFTAEATFALNNFIGEAQSQLDALVARASVGEAGAPRPIAKQIAQAEAALARAADEENTLAVRARAVAFALNKIRVGNIVGNRLLKAPVTLEGKFVTINSRFYGVTLDPDGSYLIGDPEAPDESGSWSYERTGANTGLLTLSTSEGGTHLFNLTFKNTSSGAVAGSLESGDFVSGRFLIQDAE